MPPGLREERQPGKERIGQHREGESATAPQPITDAAEEAAAQRPTDEEGALDEGGVQADLRIIFVRNAQQLRDERDRHERVEVHVQTVEHPAEPRGDAGFPLLG